METNQACPTCGDNLFIDTDCTYYCQTCDNDGSDSDPDELTCSVCSNRAHTYIYNKEKYYCQQCLEDHTCKVCSYVHDIPHVYYRAGVKYRRDCIPCPK